MNGNLRRRYQLYLYCNPDSVELSGEFPDITNISGITGIDDVGLNISVYKMDKRSDMDVNTGRPWESGILSTICTQ